MGIYIQFNDQDTSMHPAFEVHMLNEEGRAGAKAIADMFDSLLKGLQPILYDKRCAALVTTKLEEACFFAKKALALNPDAQLKP